MNEKFIPAVLRGGSMGSNTRNARLMTRYVYGRHGMTQGWGFRLAKTPVFSTSTKAEVNAMNYVKPEMVSIKGGDFLMGSPVDDKEAWDDEFPQHEVHVNDFEIGKYPVTFDEFDAFCEATGRVKPDDEGWGRGRRPVINVSWYDAVAYCEWLSTQTGETYRLPTEEEWEYACRAGTQTKYYFGDDPAKLGEYAWYSDNSDDQTHPVGEKLPNAWGLYDMLGNVWEWTSSEYKSYGPD